MRHINGIKKARLCTYCSASLKNNKDFICLNCKMKQMFTQFKNNVFFTIMILSLLWVLLYTNKDLFDLLMYIKDIENWRKDSLSYLGVGLFVIVPSVLILSIYTLFSCINNGLINRISLMLITLVLISFLTLEFVADKALSSEIEPLNYKRYYNRLQIVSSHELLNIAKKLEKDCLITIVEYNFDTLNYDVNIAKSSKIYKKVNIGECNFNSKEKKELIDFLIKKGTVAYN